MSAVGAQVSPPGIDLERLGRWWAENVTDLDDTFDVQVLTGGRSNLTYIVTTGGQRWVLRRPPLGHVLATAHDMSREFRMISALRDTPVPVPDPVAQCDDSDVIGAPFYVMSHVPGTAYTRASQLDALPAGGTRAVVMGLVDALATLHTVDSESVGLADFGRPHGYLERQVRRWKQQLDSSHSRDLPAALELHRLLQARVPAESSTGIVHGDYSLGNVLVTENNEPSAILDWEMATLGDPLSDVAMMAIYHRLGLREGEGIVSDVSRAKDFPTEDEIIARYAGRIGRDLADFPFHLGLAAFKLATITEGLHYRYLQGQTVGPGFDTIGESVDPLLEMGLTAMRKRN